MPKKQVKKSNSHLKRNTTRTVTNYRPFQSDSGVRKVKKTPTIKNVFIKTAHKSQAMNGNKGNKGKNHSFSKRFLQRRHHLSTLKAFKSHYKRKTPPKNLVNKRNSGSSKRKSPPKGIKNKNKSKNKSKKR